MKAYLKIKVLSLAAEAVLIKREEIVCLARAARMDKPARRRDLESTYAGLRNHRLCVVRPEARAACLAYAFLRGRSYRQVEPTTYSLPDWDKVTKLVQRYGRGDRREVAGLLEAWKDEALTRLAEAA